MGKAFGMSEEEFHQMYEEIMFPKLEYRSLEKDYDISKNVNTSICAKCGGACCKVCGCHFSPDDFQEISFESLKKEIENGYISIDYVDGEMIHSDNGVYILRVRNQDSPIVDMLFRGRVQCILLGKNGCKLDYEHRPTGGKLLIPDSISIVKHKMQCMNKYSIRDCCYEWLPHKKILYQLVQYFEDKDIPCSLK